MKHTLMMIFCGAGLLASGCSKSHRADPGDAQTPEANGSKQPDAVILQGKWTGQEVGDKSLGTPTLTLDGTHCEFRGSHLEEWYLATYSLREDKRPKQIEAVITQCPIPQYVGQTVHGIYKLEKGTLTFTVNKPGLAETPANFDSPQARQFIFTLEH